MSRETPSPLHARQAPSPRPDPLDPWHHDPVNETDDLSGHRWTASVVVPAHNEAGTIDHLLRALTTGATPGELDVVVVCNGCTDETAEVARRHGGLVRVFETAEASKRKAQLWGDTLANGFPRAYVDADVSLSLADLRLLVQPLHGREVLATAPARKLNDRRSSVWVRLYYRTWCQLPQVQSGLFGRGVVVVSASGHDRVRALPEVMSDDLVMSQVFEPTERKVVESAKVVINLPRSVRDLVRRRERVATGNVQADELGLRDAHARTSPADLLAMVRSDPRMMPPVLTFGVITLVARLRSRRRVRAGDYTTWGRDESSRSSL